MKPSQILVVDDEADIRGMVQEILTEEGYDVRTAGNAAEARAARSHGEPDLMLLDIWMPDMDGISLLREWTRDGALAFPVVMMSGHGTVETAVEATRLGAVDFVEKPLSLAKLLRTVEQAVESGKHKRGHRPGAPRPALEPVGKSRAMQTLRDQLRRIAPHEASVLLMGEAGSGRETLARYLHALGPRAAGPFVPVSLAGLQLRDMLESLCGREGAESPGCFEQAKGGTLFLSELADLRPEGQAALLGVLEQGAFTRVGSQTAHTIDVRLICAAEPRLEAQLDQGQFRRDLYNRLAAVTVRVPALREYREDVPELLRYFTDVLVDAQGLKYRRFSVAAQNRLRNYPWPGNLNELSNLVSRMLMLGDSGEVTLEEVEAALAPVSGGGDSLIQQDILAMPLREAREHFEKAYLEQQLQLCGGKVGKLAERVGMERTHLYRKLNSLGIDFRQLGGDEADN
ncbi:MAG TPA: sigma-54 dependent transcriptional regulator [Gammaproteobacteria bacterium]|nr:sigma-54 dependent transcriptional regulator [Gammaproteobacteria bacterium]